MPTSSSLRAIMVGLCLAALPAGCNRSDCRIELKPDEAIRPGHSVYLDDRPVGRVTAVANTGAARYADITITDRSARADLRPGIAREYTGDMRLSSAAVDPQAPPLAPGAVIPTRAPLTHMVWQSRETVAKSWTAIAEFSGAHPATATLALLAVAALILAACRAGQTRGPLLGLTIAVFLVATATGHAAVKRTEVERPLQQAEARIEKARHEAADARRFAAAQLYRLTQEGGVRALFWCDQTAALEDEARRKLPQLGFFVGEETKEALAQRCARLSQERKQIADEMADLAGTAPPQDRLIKLYLQQRARITSQVGRDDSMDASPVVTRLADLARYPINLVDATMAIHWDNVSLCRLEADRAVLPDGTAIPFGFGADAAQSATRENDRLAVIEQNTADLQVKLDLLEKRGAASVSVAVPAPALSNALPVLPAQASAAVAPAASESTSPQSENAGESAATPVPQAPATTGLVLPSAGSAAKGAVKDPPPEQSAAKADESVPTSPTPSAGRSTPVRGLVIVACALLLAGAVMAATAALRRGTGYTLVVADEQSHETVSHEIALGDEVLLLGRPVETIDRADPRTKSEPIINVAWHGPRVCAGSAATVTVDDIPVRSSHRLRPGSRLSIRRPDGSQAAYAFLGCERQPNTAEANG